MRPWIKGCLVAGLAAAAVLGIVALLVAPVAVREGRKVVEPIRKMEQAGKRLERLTEEKAWTAPAREAVTADQLQRFLAVRRSLDEIYRRFQPRIERFPDRHAKSVHEGLEVMQTMAEFIPAQLEAFVAADMTPKEYHWVQKVVYGTWRPALRASGRHPEGFALASQEVSAAAAAETDPAVAARLVEIAERLRQTRPPAPEGFDAETHERLLDHLDDIERYSLDSFRDIPAPPPP